MHDESRRELGFSEAARLAFAFLETDFAFHLARAESPTSVRFERGRVHVHIYHGRRDYCVGAEIGRRIIFGLVDDTVTLFEILRSLDQASVALIDRPAESPDEIRAHVNELATIVRDHAKPWLRGEAWAFRKARRFRRSLNRRTLPGHAA